MKAPLVDAGPLCAILNDGDQHHQACTEALKALPFPLLTTWAAFTEAAYLLGKVFGLRGQMKLIDLCRTGRLVIAEPAAHPFDRVAELIEKYGDLPMDLADATLVAVAEERGATTIFTVDRIGFETYRLKGRKAFRVVP